MSNYATIIAGRLELNQRQVEKTIELLEQGATVPFIARYRKEATAQARCPCAGLRGHGQEAG